jgi:hypothetical protein
MKSTGPAFVTSSTSFPTPVADGRRKTGCAAVASSPTTRRSNSSPSIGTSLT